MVHLRGTEIPTTGTRPGTRGSREIGTETGHTAGTMITTAPTTTREKAAAATGIKAVDTTTSEPGATAKATRDPTDLVTTISTKTAEEIKVMVEGASSNPIMARDSTDHRIGATIDID